MYYCCDALIFQADGSIDAGARGGGGEGCYDVVCGYYFSLRGRLLLRDEVGAGSVAEED